MIHNRHFLKVLYGYTQNRQIYYMCLLDVKSSLSD